MKNIDLDKLTSELLAFSQERDWDKFHSVKNLSTALCVEGAELAEIFQWMTEEESTKAYQDPNLKEKIEDEVADVFVYLLRIIGKTNIDLEQAVRKKMFKNGLKYPLEKSRGNSKKYDDL